MKQDLLCRLAEKQIRRVETRDVMVTSQIQLGSQLFRQRLYRLNAVEHGMIEGISCQRVFDRETAHLIIGCPSVRFQECLSAHRSMLD